ncbi:MAG: hypothetical protein HAW67_01550 [Endozoicomonadaceae bacterium]|nr:hypothetical protein [Endozoicomonadaceae bacterium]
MCEKEWFNTHQPVAPLETGTELLIDGVVGLIDEICKHGIAEYRVKMADQDESDNSRRIIMFESAIPHR